MAILNSFPLLIFIWCNSERDKYGRMANSAQLGQAAGEVQKSGRVANHECHVDSWKEGGNPRTL